MTATSHTLYTLMLFLALAVLNLWTERRRGTPRRARSVPGFKPQDMQPPLVAAGNNPLSVHGNGVEIPDRQLLVL